MAQKKQRVRPGSDGDDARYAILPARVVTDPRLTFVHYRILAYLGRINTDRGWMELSQTEMATLWSYSRQAVNKAVGELVKWHYIEKRGQVETGRSRCHYRTLIDDPTVFNPAGSGEGVSGRDDTGVSPVDDRGVSGTDDTGVA